jgi:hypothetical protein
MATNVDAIMQMADQILTDSVVGGAGGVGVMAERYLALIHIDEERLNQANAQIEAAVAAGDLEWERSAKEHVVGSHQTGGVVTAAKFAQLLLQSKISVLVKRFGKPVTVTSPKRLTPLEMRLAILARDRTCTHPGCGRTSFLEIHHVKPWSQGGQTRLDNLVAKCRKHHRQIDMDGFSDSFDDGKYKVFGPEGELHPGAM